MSYRFLFSTTPGFGHLHPLVPLARALRHAGHDVAFAGRAFLEPRVQAAGFAFFPVGTDREADPAYRRFKEQRARMTPGFETELFIYSRLFCGIMPRLMTPGLVEVGRSWKPDMFVREAAEYGSVIAAEHLGLPHATVSFAAALRTLSVFEKGAAERLDPIRQSWDLPPDPDLSSLYRHLYLGYSPTGFALQDVGVPGGSHPLPATTQLIRPQFYDDAQNESLPDWFAHLPPQPNVYVTLGTEVNNEPEFYPRVLQTIITGLRDAPINLIVTLGRDKDPADFGPQPANVHIERYIPQSLLLKHCDLMVMHGGSNSLLAAVDVGLPLVIVPLIADQFFNAHVAQSIRLGQVVQLGELNATAVRAAVDQVLDNPIYRQNALRLQAELHSLPDQNYAVELVERVAGG